MQLPDQRSEVVRRGSNSSWLRTCERTVRGSAGIRGHVTATRCLGDKCRRLRKVTPFLPPASTPSYWTSNLGRGNRVAIRSRSICGCTTTDSGSPERRLPERQQPDVGATVTTILAPFPRSPCVVGVSTGCVLRSHGQPSWKRVCMADTSGSLSARSRWSLALTWPMILRGQWSRYRRWRLRAIGCDRQERTVHSFGGAPYYGSPYVVATGLTASSGIAATPERSRLLACDLPRKRLPHSVDAHSIRIDWKPFTSVAPIVGITSTSDGRGYWLVASRRWRLQLRRCSPSTARRGTIRLNRPVVGIPSTSEWPGLLVGRFADGGIFSFGDAVSFHGSTGAIRFEPPPR